MSAEQDSLKIKFELTEASEQDKAIKNSQNGLCNFCEEELLLFVIMEINNKKVAVCTNHIKT